MSRKRRPRFTIDHEGLQRVSALGATDPDTGVRYCWRADSAINFLNELLMDPKFTPARYCNRCEAYDKELAILPGQKWLPKKSRRSIVIQPPVNLPWQPGKKPEDAKLQQWQKSRPGRPMMHDSCHMCLISFLDEHEQPELSDEVKELLKTEWRAARDEVARLTRSNANENPQWLADYIARRLEQAWRRLRRAGDACRDNGVEPMRPRTQRIGEDPPELHS